MRIFIVPCILLCLSACGIDAQSVVIGTFNVRWDDGSSGPTSWQARRETALAVTANVDILALQELMPTQVEDFSSLDGFTLLREGQVGLLVRNSQQAVRTTTIALAQGEFVRVALCAEVDTLQVCSVHANGDKTVEDLQRLKRVLGDAPTRTIVMGDFNRVMSTNPWMDPGLPMVGNWLNDAVGIALPNNRVPSGCGWAACPHFDFDARIDWILTSSDLLVQSATIAQVRTPEGINVSDHWPVFISVDKAERIY